MGGPGSNPTPPVVATGGASFDNPGSGTVNFPVSQLAVTFDANGTPSAATGINNAGTTITQTPTGLLFTVNVPAADINNVPLIEDCSDCYRADLSGGRKLEVVLDGETDAGDLSYLRFGDWSIYGSGGQLLAHSPLIGGYETPDAAVPTSGTATYAADVEGYVAFSTPGGALVGELEGTATISADFGANTLTGAITGMEVGVDTGNSYQSGSWNDFSFSATLSGNNFAGTTAVTSAPGGMGTLASGATGTIGGGFYGPNAEEIGAIWSLSDGNATALGTIAGTQQ